MKGIDQIIDLSNPREKLNLINNIRVRKGVHRVAIRQEQAKRSNQANRYLWGVVYAAFVEFRQSQGESFESDEAHEFFKLKFLRRPVVDVETGRVLGQTVRSTTTMSTSEFAEYIDKVVAWMSDYGIEVPAAGVYREVAPA